MSAGPLMPKATAVWLIDNTSLTFDQVADFCHLHPLEVKGIADGEVAAGIKAQIEKAEADEDYRMKLAVSNVRLPEQKRRKGPRYTPLSRRQDRPNAILWLLRNHPELKDAPIMRLVGTTKTTIQQVRDRSHWNAATLVPMDPVTLGLCSQVDLDFEVSRAAKDRPVVVEEAGQTLLPAQVTTARETSDDELAVPSIDELKKKSDINLESVFARFGGSKSDD